tara:strand:+ start:1875 stop:1985 length:111 start_codon:yes stop_codon:yes gene_type:complete
MRQQKKHKPLDEALKECKCIKEYEEVVELWKTYGGG